MGSALQGLIQSILKSMEGFPTISMRFKPGHCALDKAQVIFQQDPNVTGTGCPSAVRFTIVTSHIAGRTTGSKSTALFD